MILISFCHAGRHGVDDGVVLSQTWRQAGLTLEEAEQCEKRWCAATLVELGLE